MFGFICRLTRPHGNARRPARLGVESLELRENPAAMPWTGEAPVTISNPTVTEGAVATFVVTPKVGHPVINATYETVDGSASGNTDPDFQIVTGRLSWAVGDNTPKTIKVQTIDDAAYEPQEGFRFRLSDTELNTWTSPPSPVWQADGFGTINDNDPLVSVGDAQATEGTPGSAQIGRAHV